MKVEAWGMNKWRGHSFTSEPALLDTFPKPLTLPLQSVVSENMGLLLLHPDFILSNKDVIFIVKKPIDTCSYMHLTL